MQGERDVVGVQELEASEMKERDKVAMEGKQRGRENNGDEERPKRRANKEGRTHSKWRERQISLSDDTTSDTGAHPFAE